MNKESERFRYFKDYASLRCGGFTIKKILRELNMASKKELNELLNDEKLNWAYRVEMKAMILKFSWHREFYEKRGQKKQYVDCLLELREIINNLLKACGHDQD